MLEVTGCIYMDCVHAIIRAQFSLSIYKGQEINPHMQPCTLKHLPLSFMQESDVFQENPLLAHCRLLNNL